MKTFGLLGRNISYSFSSGYFSEKFTELKLEKHQYVNFDIEDLSDFYRLISDEINPVFGMNVTIPYKQDVMQYLDEIDEAALEIGAVNTVKFLSNGKTKGFNTDVFGFEKSLKPLLENQHQKALILGTGGASKAVAYVLKKLQISFLFVSRNPIDDNQISYSEIDEILIKEHSLLVNCTPLGTFPNVNSQPDLPYQHISSNHVLYDLIYNPSITAFLKRGKEKGAIIKNGLEMLQLQAEKSWEIWNS
mgnify:CR=1 FL=1